MQRSTTLLTRPLLLALGLTALGAGLAYWIIGMPPLLGAEDAAIGFRYARNFAEGQGIVFNPGGERVEGFTSVLWLFVSAGVFAVVGAASLESVLLVLSLGLTVVTLTTILWLLLEEVPRGPGRWVALVWLAGQAGFYFWSSLSLMDVALWAAGLTTFLLLLYLRMEGRPSPRGLLAVTVVALALTRPESMLVVPAAVVVAGFAYGPGPRLKSVAIEVLSTIVLSVGLLTAFRMAYFGQPLPNTYYVKVSPDVVYRLRGGLGYVGGYFGDHPTALLPALAVVGFLALRLVALARGPDRTGARDSVPEGSDASDPTASGSVPARPAEAEPTRSAVALATLTAGLGVVGFASVVYGGGDHYQGHRFLQAYLPMAAIPLGVGVALLQRGVERLRAGAGLPVAVGVVLLAGLPVVSDWSAFRAHDLRRQAFDVGLQGRFVGLTLDRAFADAERPELGLWMVGGAGYAYTGPVKDLLGLNWIAMGTSPGDRKGPRDHAAFNIDVFWSAPPEIMIPEPEAVLRGVRCVRGVLDGALRGLLVTPRFEAEFEPVRIRYDDSEPMIAYARSDWLETAPAVVEPLGWSYCTGGQGSG